MLITFHECMRVCMYIYVYLVRATLERRVNTSISSMGSRKRKPSIVRVPIPLPQTLILYQSSRGFGEVSFSASSFVLSSSIRSFLEVGIV
jgi:hypothetical protein